MSPTYEETLMTSTKRVKGVKGFVGKRGFIYNHTSFIARKELSYPNDYVVVDVLMSDTFDRSVTNKFTLRR